MEDSKQPEITEDIASYFRIQYDIIQLKAIRQVSIAGSNLFATLFFTMLIAMAIILASLGLAFYLSELLNSYTRGFSLTGGIFILLAIFFFIFRRPLLLRPIRNAIISSFPDNSDKTEL